MEEKNIKKRHKRRSKEIQPTNSRKLVLILLVVATMTIIFNQTQISQVYAAVTKGTSSAGGTGTANLETVDISTIKSTGHTIAAVFPVKDWSDSNDVMTDMFPTGTPDYGSDLGVSFDTPVESLAVLSKMYRGLKQEVEQNNPDGWNRFMNLASKPVGISCEYCCGLGPVGIDKRGNSACGCQHNPALLSVALYLSAYTNYSDAQILHEVMRWKTLFFPKDMIKLGTTVAGGDTSALKDLPGMVGGC